jgi:predicted GIY-YIG superfamily endonuclease
MPFHANVLRNREGRLYIGSTGDLRRRLAEHQEGRSRWTRNRGPWQLVHYESFPNRSGATRRERQLKSGSGRAWLADHLTGAPHL